MKIGTQQRAHTPAGSGHRTLSQTVAGDISKQLTRALTSMRHAKEVGAQRAQRKEFAALLDDIKQIEARLMAARNTAEDIKRGKHHGQI